MSGFHRVYRRLLEANKRLISDPKDRRLVQRNLKQAFLFPNRYGGRCPLSVCHCRVIHDEITGDPWHLLDRVFDVIEESHTLAFLNKYANELVDGISSKAPPFFVTAAKVR